jgi:hypothetical protein
MNCVKWLHEPFYPLFLLLFAGVYGTEVSGDEEATSPLKYVENMWSIWVRLIPKNGTGV